MFTWTLPPLKELDHRLGMWSSVSALPTTVAHPVRNVQRDTTDPELVDIWVFVCNVSATTRLILVTHTQANVLTAETTSEVLSVCLASKDIIWMITQDVVRSVLVLCLLSPTTLHQLVLCTMESCKGVSACQGIQDRDVTSVPQDTMEIQESKVELANHVIAVATLT